MKQTCTILLACLAMMTTDVRAEQEKQTAKLESVTIFTNGAQVKRTKTVALKPGEQTVTFTGFSPYMDTKSLQVRANGKLTVLGVSHRRAIADSLSQARKLTQAEQAVASVERRIQQVQDEQQVVDAQAEMVKANCSVAGRTVATPLANIKELNNYYAQELLTLKKRSQTLAEQLKDLEKEQARTKKTLDSLHRVKPKEVFDVDVKVSAPQAAQAAFSISYYVTNASWYPSYDIYSTGINKPVDMSYKVNIVQNTKEDWQQANITLSSANPNRSNTAPVLGTYWLDFEKPVTVRRASRKGLARAAAAEPMMLEKSVDEALQGSVAGLDIVPEEESELIEVQQQQSLFGYEFTIGQPLSLPSSTKAIATEIARYQLPANYIYKAYPKKDKEAFLVAEVTDWQKLNLLEGDANVFYDNSYVGKSRLNTSSSTDTLLLSLGRDPSIRVERTKVNEKSTRRFLGSNQEQTVTWNIKVTNTRREAVKLNVYDQTPIARNSDINVTVEELSGGQRNKDTGIVTWNLDLNAGEKQELLLQYKVKYPKNERLLVE
jgi:uncharacterized protein (TIGR02231 family)